MGRKNVFLMGDTAFLPGAKAAVVMTEDVGFLEDKKFTAPEGMKPLWIYSTRNNASWMRWPAET